MDASVREKFLEEAAKIFSMRDNRKVEFHSRLRADLNATSMQYFALISVIEELTDVELTYAQIKGCETLEDALKLAEGE